MAVEYNNFGNLLSFVQDGVGSSLKIATPLLEGQLIITRLFAYWKSTKKAFTIHNLPKPKLVIV